ncbi:hypothetical protein Q7C36_020561 [Tachysurus vachellii]|uniref:Uncharacterized protein n=1 Tax=Tachysurus vachellii TaxID=175792 RepID=A0AA88JB48_TACVA|nr:hypothetical protein Q7C36_020561 [Tachysurus vachellii]
MRTEQLCTVSECKRTSDHGGRPVHRPASPLTSSAGTSASVFLATFSPGVPCPPGISVRTRIRSLVSQSLHFSVCTFNPRSSRNSSFDTTTTE